MIVYGSNRGTSTKGVSRDPDLPVAERIVEFIDKNYASPISLRDVAEAFGYSACHLTHTFSRSTGIPITAWIIKRRIRAAQQLLSEANVDVATACEAVGFNDLCYFTRQFVRHVGTTPGRFRAATNGDLRERAASA
jgi:AraC family transcriptional activator of pobA